MQDRALLPPPTPISGVQRCLPAQPHAGADRIRGAQPCSDTWGHAGESSVPLSDSREGLMEEVQGGGFGSLPAAGAFWGTLASFVPAARGQLEPCYGSLPWGLPGGDYSASLI